MPGHAIATFLVLLALLPPAAGAATPEQRVARLEAEYAQTGEYERCLSRHRIDRVDIIDQSRILFRVGVNRFYLNVLSRPCPALSVHDTLLIDTRTARLCDIDTVRVLEPGQLSTVGHPGPACFLGRFQRLERRASDD